MLAVKRWGATEICGSTVAPYEGQLEKRAWQQGHTDYIIHTQAHTHSHTHSHTHTGTHTYGATSENPFVRGNRAKSLNTKLKHK